MCAVTPLHQPGTEHLFAGSQNQGSGAGSMLCPQTSRAGTVVELQNYPVIQLVGTSHGFPCWFWPRAELIFSQWLAWGCIFCEEN